MKDGKAYFTQQEEEISDTYMSANGVQQVTTGYEKVKLLYAGIIILVILSVVSHYKNK
jgi:hypothetical protein